MRFSQRRAGSGLGFLQPPDLQGQLVHLQGQPGHLGVPETLQELLAGQHLLTARGHFLKESSWACWCPSPPARGYIALVGTSEASREQP